MSANLEVVEFVAGSLVNFVEKNKIFRRKPASSGCSVVAASCQPNCFDHLQAAAVISSEKQFVSRRAEQTIRPSSRG
ncbi:uncharacterized protein CLUP02_07228 [Colletotrichum lupini]|uniref:Uncharacterized protein n=1 Tax=Colletotrichum lupini TaxID=145971 RepID=A0A9Q8WGA7_9PEZI|nr:uncharacterized protein CLUP02_07228 [Colletotrichum lupini]UQC81742.1 hypothetical protein CLUP02_07228 [Colletotrichum lupini]